jgi:uncharacterized protein YxeA
MKKILFVIILIILVVNLFSCNRIKTIDFEDTSKDESNNLVEVKDDNTKNSNNESNSIENNENNTQQSVEYDNTEYGFSFSLPNSWKGYTIVTENWEGRYIDSDKTNETGIKISIRHPDWTTSNPRQDIPILIINTEQWDLIYTEVVHIGAAPTNPSELGRNSNYVFALPARYNYEFLPGFEEVEDILGGTPLKVY